MDTQFLTIAGGRIAYDDSETGGALVVCVPGYGENRTPTDTCARLLVAAGYRVVTADVRGGGVVHRRLARLLDDVRGRRHHRARPASRRRPRRVDQQLVHRRTVLRRRGGGAGAVRRAGADRAARPARSRHRVWSSRSRSRWC